MINLESPSEVISQAPELEIFFWEHATFLGADDIGPPRIIPIMSILSQAARLAMVKTIRDVDGYDSDQDEDASNQPSESVRESQKVWVTVGLTMDPCVI
ncbi:hypothetical protein HWV62_26670 [Athelia sp. TMB]|nr:hypothetical protein HWV62_26670 [Athelia sp. TMB]